MQKFTAYDIAQISLLACFIIIAGSFKIPTGIPGSEFQLSAPVAVAIAVVFGFKRYFLAGIIAESSITFTWPSYNFKCRNIAVVPIDCWFDHCFLREIASCIGCCRSNWDGCCTNWVGFYLGHTVSTAYYYRDSGDDYYSFMCVASDKYTADN